MGGAYWLGRIDGKRDALEPTFEVRDEVQVIRVGPVGAQTVSKLDGGHTGLYYDWAELVSVFRPDAKRVLLLGLGGGEMLRVLKRTLPAAQLTAVDNDARVIALAREHFAANVAGVELVERDAWKFLRTVTGTGGASFSYTLYDGIIVDLYEGSHMVDAAADAAFYTALVGRLGPRGVVLVNVNVRAQAHSVAEAMRAGGLHDVYAIAAQANVMLLGTVRDDWGEVNVPPALRASVGQLWQP